MERQLSHNSVQIGANKNSQTHYPLHRSCSKHCFGSSALQQEVLDDQRGTGQEAVHTSRKCVGGQSRSPPLLGSIVAYSLLRLSMLKLPERSQQDSVIKHKESVLKITGCDFENERVGGSCDLQLPPTGR